MERWGRAATALGLATAWLAPNPISAAALSFGRSTRWILMHHIGHRGYDHVPDVPPRYTSKVFARGYRRFIDWPDWMVPEAWIYEHNVLHHSHTGHDKDPDLVERNTHWVHGLPTPVRWTIFGFLTATWRMSYYAQNTMEELLGRGGEEPTLFDTTKAVLWRCWLPYAALQFGALPLAYAPLGPLAMKNVLVNSLIADVLTNVHTFLVVGPNHAGDDLYRFHDKPRSKAERLVRQVLGTVNYRTGSDGGFWGTRLGRDVIDMGHLWLNYQIEHHLYPDLPMLKYQEYQPQIRAICERYGLPYVQESVFKRFVKMAKNFVGDTKMRSYDSAAHDGAAHDSAAHDSAAHDSAAHDSAAATSAAT
jgi:fatty acid desaturase